jgi:hypothetical protein
MAKKQNAFLAKLQAQAAKKEAVKTEAHVEIDTMALPMSANDVLQVGAGRASKLINSFLAYKLEIAEAIVKELDEDKSKRKEIIVLRRDLAARMKEILGKEGWERYHTLFPFLKDYWEWEVK